MRSKTIRRSRCPPTSTNRAREVERAFAGAPLDAAQHAAVERLTRRIVNKIVHGPVAALRGHQAARTEAFYVEAARRLFQLDDAPSDDEQDE